MRRFYFLFFFLVFPQASLAYKLSPPALLSYGGAGGASLKEDISYLVNPAVIGFQKTSKGAILYSFNPFKQTALLSFLDRKTNLPLAFTYQRLWDNSLKKSGPDKMTVSWGFLVSPYLSLGLSMEKALKAGAWSANIGSVFRLKERFSLALFVNQFLKKERVLALAGHYNWKQIFSTSLDVSKTDHQGWVFRGGWESFFSDFFSIRLGGVWIEKQKKRLISGGLAFQSPKLSLEYSVQQNGKIYQQALLLMFHI